MLLNRFFWSEKEPFYSLPMKIITCFFLFATVFAAHEGLVRLSHRSSNAELPHSGFLEMFVNRRWLAVTTCSTTNWTMVESDVVCRQLGYSAAASVLDSKYYCPSMKYIGRRSAVVTDVTCTGLEDALLQCQFAVELSIRNCTPCGVVCAVPNGVRLTNRTEMHHGILEMLNDLEWIPVCGNTFNSQHAKVACRQLGYLDGSHSISEEPEIEGSFAFITGNCSGNEPLLAWCSSDQEDPIQLVNCSSSVFLQCYGPPFKPCLRSSSQSMCDSITVGWTAPHSSPKADSFIVEYRVLEGGDAWSQAEFNWNDTQESLITVEINKLKPLEIYEVTVQAKNYYGNSSVSNPAVTRTNMSDLLSRPTHVEVISVGATWANISWQIQTPDCPSVLITGYDIHFVDTKETRVTLSFMTSRLIVTGVNAYLAHVTGLDDRTSYNITVRAFACLAMDSDCIGSYGTIYGPFSEPALLSTTPGGDSGFLSLPFLSSPYTSLSLLLVMAALLLLIVLSLLMLCVCAVIHRRHSRKQKRRRRIHQRPDSSGSRDDIYNIYTAGDLSEQSYIPMSSSSVPNSLRITTRRSSSNLVHQTGFWIDLPQVPPLSTFTDQEQDHRDSTSTASIRITESESKNYGSGNEREDEKSDEYDNDNPYDEIHQDNNNNSDDEKEEKVEGKDKSDENDDESLYAEIQSNTGSLSQSSDNDEGMCTLPEAHTLSQMNSQESSETTPMSLTIPPPREFAALPPVPETSLGQSQKAKALKGKGLSQSMCHIPLPPLPIEDTRTTYSPKSASRRNTTDGPRRRRGSKEVQVIPSHHRSKTVTSDTRERMNASGNRQRKRRKSLDGPHSPIKAPMLVSREEEGPYYSIPPLDDMHKKTYSLKTPKPRTLNEEGERNSSPEYEILVHPSSSSLSSAMSDKLTVVGHTKSLSRPSRPPPPIPAVHFRPTSPTSENQPISNSTNVDTDK